jgi:hypothetical protein
METVGKRVACIFMVKVRGSGGHCLEGLQHVVVLGLWGRHCEWSVTSTLSQTGLETHIDTGASYNSLQ